MFEEDDDPVNHPKHYTTHPSGVECIAITEWMNFNLQPCYRGTMFEEDDDPVNHPKHYTTHPSGVECIAITEWMNFNLGNVVKYVWRAGEKGSEIQDLEKARWHIEREISRLKRAKAPQTRQAM